MKAFKTISSSIKLKKMKTKIILTALLLAVLGTGVYFYFKQSRLIEPPIPKFDKRLVGSWKIDTAYNKNDSNKLSILIPFLFKDSAIISFGIDSSLETVSGKERDLQKYYLNRDTLFIEEDSTTEKVSVKFINDSLINLTSSDSTVVVYSKVKK